MAVGHGESNGRKMTYPDPHPAAVRGPNSKEDGGQGQNSQRYGEQYKSLGIFRHGDCEWPIFGDVPLFRINWVWPGVWHVQHRSVADCITIVGSKCTDTMSAFILMRSYGGDDGRTNLRACA